MRIQIISNDRNVNLSLPTVFVFNPAGAWIAGQFVRHHGPDTLEGISAEAMSRLFAEIRRIKKKYGSWDLVEVESADGERIRIML